MNAVVPRTLDEALDARAAHPELVPVAGGTDLMVALNARRLRPPGLLDLSHVEELRGWRRGDGTVFVGAGMTFATIARELAEFRPLAEAARSVGSPAIRNRATIGGNLGTASPAGDSIPVLAAYDADVVVRSRLREQRLAWDYFLEGPKRTALAPDELIVGVEWRAVAAPGSFTKVGTRNAMVISIAGACLQLEPRGVRLALGSVAPTVIRVPGAEAYASDVVDWDDPERPLAPAHLEAFGRLAAEAAQPIDDLRGTATYRRHAVAVLARRLLTRALEERRC